MPDIFNENNSDYELSVNDNYSESENESDYDNIIYDPEELSTTKYNIVICERYNELIHGISSVDMNNHYLTYIRFKQLDMNIINSFFQNGNGNFRLEIAECIYLPSYHCISIIKTLWLKIIQRKWKSIYKERKICIARRRHPNALKYRQIYGQWPYDCYYPLLKGMMSNLLTCSSGISST
jgi:hypothetical protein